MIGSPNINMLCENAEDRAQWNASLEKDLVDLIRDHVTPEYKGQNRWSSETWNLTVKKFHQTNPHAKYEKKKIQDKEKELKREYKMIKEIRQQSGVSWDDQLCMILADPPLWRNIIIVSMLHVHSLLTTNVFSFTLACSYTIFVNYVVPP